MADEVMLDEIQMGYLIKSDCEAEWALKKIREREAERDRFTALCDQEIERIREQREKEIQRCQTDTGFFMDALDRYMDTVKAQKTKTGILKYRLLSGSIVRKPGGFDYVKDDECLTKFLLENGHEDMVRTVHKPAWGDFKKLTAVINDQLIDTTTGSVVEGVAVIQTPPKFTVEWKKEEEK